MHPNVRRLLHSLAATALLGLVVAGTPTDATAAPIGDPVGGCGSSRFELMTVKDVVKDAPKEFHEAIRKADNNADGWLCVKRDERGGTFRDNNAPL